MKTGSARPSAPPSRCRSLGGPSCVSAQPGRLLPRRGHRTNVLPDLRRRGLSSANGLFDAASIAWADSLYIEAFPTSPLILNPFNDELLVPKAMRPTSYDEYCQLGEPARPG